MSTPTLLEDLEAMLVPGSDSFRNLTGERAARLRSAAQRLREEMDCTRPGCISCAVARRINGGPTARAGAESAEQPKESPPPQQGEACETCGRSDGTHWEYACTGRRPQGEER